MTEVTDLEFPFDTTEFPFPHRNTPDPGGMLAAPDGTKPFDFDQDVFPPKHQASIESPDLTDPTIFDSMPRSHAEMMDQLKAKGLLDVNEPSHRGPQLEAASGIGMLDVSTPLENAAETAPKPRRGRPRSTPVEDSASDVSTTPESDAAVLSE